MRKLLAVCLFLASAAHAQIGSITEFSGNATIKRGKESIAAQKGTPIEQNDKIETKNGKLKIVFKDETTVSVTEHSSLVIDDFVYDPKSGKGSLGMKATGGTVRYVSGALAKDPKQVKINTPTAAIAVRGTDFVMSVNETGGSMVILMPSCDWETSAVKGVSCTSGKIDVESGPNLVSMDRPYQATLVETAGQPPTPPITVNLFGTPIGNNLQIAPPRTISGAPVIAAARAAAVATGVTRENRKDGKEDKDDKDSGDEKSHASDKKNSSAKKVNTAKASDKGDSQSGENKEEEKTTTSAEVKMPGVETDLAGALGDSVLAVNQSDRNGDIESSSTTSEEDPYVKKIWKNKAETQQVGWGYERLSQTGRNYSNVTLPMDTKALVSVTQDGITTSWNFGGTRALGSITIVQTSR